MSDLIKNEDLARTIIAQQAEIAELKNDAAYVISTGVTLAKNLDSAAIQIAELKARISELERRPGDEMRLMAELRSKR